MIESEDRAPDKVHIFFFYRLLSSLVESRKRRSDSCKEWGVGGTLKIL